MSRRDKNQNKYYGIGFGDPQIRLYVKLACFAVSPSNAKEAELLLLETIAVETNNGNAKDYSPIYGEGLTQFDRPTFNYIKKEITTNKNYRSVYNRVKAICFVDVANLQYEDMRKKPLANIVLSRLLYFVKPGAIPTTFDGRWKYYKKWWNSTAGATTYQKYVRASKRALYHVVW